MTKKKHVKIRSTLRYVSFTIFIINHPATINNNIIRHHNSVLAVLSPFVFRNRKTESKSFVNFGDCSRSLSRAATARFSSWSMMISRVKYSSRFIRSFSFLGTSGIAHATSICTKPTTFCKKAKKEKRIKNAVGQKFCYTKRPNRKPYLKYHKES